MFLLMQFFWRNASERILDDDFTIAMRLFLMVKLQNAIKAGDVKVVCSELDRLLAEGCEAKELLDRMIESLREVGEAFSKGEAFIPEMLIAARAMQAGANHIGPELVKANVPKMGKLMLATVKGDLHDVGKNLIALVFRGNGFEVIDLGVDVGPDRLAAEFEANRPDIVGLSALLTTTMPAMAEAVRQLRAKYPEAKIMVGGAPVTKEYSRKIGADGYAPDAGAAVEEACRILEK
jgi:5-methyltetrahydrofolate--homocysteine methyltransferase